MPSSTIKIIFVLTLCTSIFTGSNGPAVDSKNSNNHYYSPFFHTKIYYSPAGNAFEVGQHLIENADIDTFKVMNNFYAKDKNSFYYQATPIPSDSLVILRTGLDAEDPIALSKSTCEADEYAKDSRNVYYRGHAIPNADPASFELILSESKLATYHCYAKDKNHVYWYANKITDSDPQTFQILNNEIGKDLKHVYKMDKIISDADPSSFEVYDNQNYISKDKRAVYIDLALMPGVDPDSLVVLSHRFFKDKLHVYFGRNLITEADPKTFQVINQYWGVDKSHVFLNETTVPNADSVTFSTFNNNPRYAKDKRFVFVVYYDERDNQRKLNFKEVDQSTFRISGGFCDYAMDKSHVYYRMEIMPDVDPSFFKTTSLCYASDGKRYFLKDKPVERSILSKYVLEELKKAATW